MGMCRDLAQCKTLTQIDNVKWHNHVDTACKKIYKDGYVVDSTVVESLLQEESLVPTAVCAFSPP
jgi:mannitol/fructose-specific phosphotransferase system IIA component (Ntr-type)